MAHNTISNKEKETKIKKVKKKTSIGLHQATHNSCIMHIIFLQIKYMHPFTSVSHINVFLNQIDIYRDRFINIILNQSLYIYLTFDITFGLNATSAFTVSQLLLKT